MRMRESEQEEANTVTDQMSSWMETHVSRRGFLGRGGKIAAGIGLGLLGGSYQPSAAKATVLNQFCCTGDICNGCPSTIGQCPSGWSYTGYTWTCCDGSGRIAYCWDCNGPSFCVCNQLSGSLC